MIRSNNKVPIEW